LRRDSDPDRWQPSRLGTPSAHRDANGRGYPLRKILYRETWSLGAYLSFFLRLVFATFGFWFLLAMTPPLVALAGAHEWIVAGGLTFVLFVWSAARPRLGRRIVGP
jgi:hypothetical protein